MTDSLNCQSCQQKFEEKKRIPMKLPCSHNICWLCVERQYNEKESIRCENGQCGRIHKLHPTKIKVDQNIVKQLAEASLNNLIATLKEQQRKIKKELQNLKEQQFSVVQSIIQQIEKKELTNNLRLQRELYALQKDIEKDIKGLNHVREQVQDQQQDIPSINENYLIKKTNQLTQEAQESIQQLKKNQTNVYEQLEKSQGNIQELQIEYEQVKKQNKKQREFTNTITQENATLKESLQKIQLENQNLQQKIDKDIQQLREKQLLIDNLQLMLQQERENARKLKEQLQEIKAQQILQITILSPNQRTLQFETRYIETIQQIKEKIKQFTDINP